MDPRIAEAIYQAVREHGQSRELARKLVRWFDAIASGNEDPFDKQSADRHLELAYSLVRPSGRPAPQQTPE